MNKEVTGKIINFVDVLKEKVHDINADQEEGLFNDDSKTKFKKLPDLEKLANLRKLHPDLLYYEAVRLCVDRTEVEEKLLIPLRHTLAALLSLQYVLTNNKSIIEDDNRPKSEVVEETASEALAQLIVLCKNLVTYDLDPISASSFDDEEINDLVNKIRGI